MWLALFSLFSAFFSSISDDEEAGLSEAWNKKGGADYLSLAKISGSALHKAIPKFVKTAGTLSVSKDLGLLPGIKPSTDGPGGLIKKYWWVGAALAAYIMLKPSNASK